MSASLCVQCGPMVKVDEDGCCVTCGASAMGPWADKAERALRVAAELRKRTRLGLQWLDVGERLINDNPAHGPGAPHVPGLFEVRNAMAVLRRPLQKGKRRA